MTTNIELAGVDERARWERLHSPDGLPSQSWAHCWALSASGIAPKLAVVTRDDTRLLVPFFERAFGETHDMATVFGLSGLSVSGDGDVAPLFACWRDYAREQGWVAGYLQVSPLCGRLFGLPAGDVIVDNGNPMYIVDLDTADPPRHASIRGNIRGAVSKGVALIHDRNILVEALLRLWPASPWRRNATATYDFSQESLRRWALDPSTSILGAGREGQVEAVTLCLVAGRHAEYLFNVSTEPGRAWSAFLLREMMGSLCGQGIRWLNLGGGVRAEDGLAQFKQRFGATRRDVHSIRQVYDPATYRALCEAAGVEGSPGGRFPPYRFAPQSTMKPD
jgi:hypothetical protein